MGWDGRRAGRDFMGWRFGVGSVMMFVVVFVVVFAPEWKRGGMEKEKGREEKGRREKRIGEGRREEEGRQEKRRKQKEKKRKERLHVYVRKGV